MDRWCTVERSKLPADVRYGDLLLTDVTGWTARERKTQLATNDLVNRILDVVRPMLKEINDETDFSEAMGMRRRVESKWAIDIQIEMDP